MEKKLPLMANSLTGSLNMFALTLDRTGSWPTIQWGSKKQLASFNPDLNHTLYCAMPETVSLALSLLPSCLKTTLSKSDCMHPRPLTTFPPPGSTPSQGMRRLLLEIYPSPSTLE